MAWKKGGNFNINLMVTVIICIWIQNNCQNFFLSDNLKPKAYSVDILNGILSLSNVKGTGCLWRGWPKLMLRDNVTQWCTREKKWDQQVTSNITVLQESNHHVCGIVGNLLYIFCFRVVFNNWVVSEQETRIFSQSTLRSLSQNKKRKKNLERGGAYTAVVKYTWTDVQREQYN